jgi:hypothetical protein
MSPRISTIHSSRKGGTDYISTNTLYDVTGVHPLEPPRFFRAYANELNPNYVDKKRKMDRK